MNEQKKDIWDSNGLLKTVNYKFDEHGLVDWKSMIPKEFVFFNFERIEKDGIVFPSKEDGSPAENLSQVKDPENWLSDERYLILGLGAINKLATIRGLKSRRFTFLRVDSTYISCVCKVTFRGNYETNFEDLEYEEAANASVENVFGDDFSKFLEPMAVNRAWARAVKNALRIRMVSDAELKDAAKITVSNKKSNSLGIDVQDALSETAQKIGAISFSRGEFEINTFEKFKEMIQSGPKASEAEEWNSWKDIPPDKCLQYLAFIRKNAKKLV